MSSKIPNDVQTSSAWIALDMTDFEKALYLTSKTYDIVKGFKVHASSEDNLCEKAEALREQGAKLLWWDRKAHDTPDTVAAIGKTAMKAEMDRMTVHAGGGIEMMMAAVEYGPADIAAITNLSSLTDAEIGINSGMPADSSTLLKAWQTKLAGVSHVVCSCNQIGLLNSRRQLSKVANRPLELEGLSFIVPGSRTISEDAGSQKQIRSATYALNHGADELVLGSEVWKTEDPRKAVQKIYETVQKNSSFSFQ